MKIVNSSYEILDFQENALDKICIAARICYQSEPKDEKSNENLVRKLIASGHHTPLEFASATVKIICDRGVMAELTRHRLASFNVESTRYVNYNKKGLEFIKPCFWSESSFEYSQWDRAVKESEFRYLALIKVGATPEQARSVLPNSLKTKIIMSCNFREWLHIFGLRCSEKSHPQMREIMIPLREEFRKRCPAVFGDFTEDAFP